MWKTATKYLNYLCHDNFILIMLSYKRMLILDKSLLPFIKMILMLWNWLYYYEIIFEVSVSFPIMYFDIVFLICD